METAQYCATCQAPLNPISGYSRCNPLIRGAQRITGALEVAGRRTRRSWAGICGILVGGFGAHKFILGYTNEGIIQIVITS